MEVEVGCGWVRVVGGGWNSKHGCVGMVGEMEVRM